MDLATQLAKKGFTVQWFDSWHCRVNGEFDFWMNAKGKPLAWHDRITDERGNKPEDQIVHFIVRRFSESRPEVDKELFVARLMEVGWREEEAREAWTERQSKASYSKG